MNADKEDEKVMDLADTSEFVLVEFCNMILRHRDIRNPEIRDRIQEIINALKVKSEKLSGEPAASNRYNLKNYIMGIEDLLKQFA